MAKRGSRGTARRGALKGGRSRIARSRGSGRTVALSAKAGGVASFGRGGGRHGPSIKKDDTYEALRRKGYSKRKAARIANAQANGTINHRGGRKRRGPSTK
jgi:hypothetical protein